MAANYRADVLLSSDHKKALRTQLLSEAVGTLELTQSDTCAALSDALHDMFPGKYAYVRDVIGDGESGDVIYCCDGDTWRAPYEIGMVNGKRTCTIDDDQAINVVPRTVYDEEADEQDHYAGMDETEASEARKMPAFMRRMIFTERFVSKAERDAADSGDFAGKGKSFPILKPGDVMAAVRSMGRAGAGNKSTDALKSSIIRIAKRKGWTKYLPKAWQGDSAATTESGGARAVEGEIKLVESVAFLEDIPLRENLFKPGYQIKLIAPGKGSSAFYPAEVLKRDGPKVFTAGTPMCINHPTKAEEAARPEGDVNNWGAVLAKDAYWLDTHKEGPGLYSEVKPFSDHVATIHEKGPYAGVSIRANGNAVMEAGRPKLHEGLPILASLTRAESVDMVTRAGAGGMFLQESASGATQQETEMTEEQITKLVESAVTQAVTAAIAGVQAPVKTLEQRALRGDAMVEANRTLKDLALTEATKQRVVETVLKGDIPVKDGALDAPKFAELVMAEAKREAAYVAQLTGSGRVVGMGSGIALTETDPKAERKRLKEAKREKKAAKEAKRDNVLAWQEFGLSESAAKIAAKGRVA
jgi:hypothetical protein